MLRPREARYRTHRYRVLVRRSGPTDAHLEAAPQAALTCQMCAKGLLDESAASRSCEAPEITPSALC